MLLFIDFHISYLSYQKLLNKNTSQEEEVTPVCLKWQKKLAPVLGKVVVSDVQ